MDQTKLEHDKQYKFEVTTETKIVKGVCGFSTQKVTDAKKGEIFVGTYGGQTNISKKIIMYRFNNLGYILFPIENVNVYE